MSTAMRGAAWSVVVIGLVVSANGVAVTAAAAPENRWLDDSTVPSASPVPTDEPSAPPSPASSPTPGPDQTATPTPAPTGTTPAPAPSPAPTPPPSATPTTTGTPTTTATPTSTSTEELVPTTGGGTLTITAPAQVGPQVQDGDILRIPVLGITVSDTREVGGFTATATASTVLADGTSPVQVPALTWTTTAVRDADGVPVPDLAGPGGALRPGAVIAQGDANGRELVIDGVITIDASDLPPGDYAFSLSLSAT